MAGLPPRPVEPATREWEGRRNPHPLDDRDRRSRPMVSPSSRYRGISDDDRVYRPPPPASRPTTDSYVAPSSSFDRRRDDHRRSDYRDEPHDRNRDRDRRDWDRDRDRARDIRERDRDRDRGPRAWEHPAEDRAPRPYRSPPRDSFRREPRSPPRRSEPSYHRHSRSPSRRRPMSPSSSYRDRPPSRPRSPRARSPPPTLSPPAKRIKLGNHDISSSPRKISPSPSRTHVSERRSIPPNSPRNDFKQEIKTETTVEGDKKLEQELSVKEETKPELIPDIKPKASPSSPRRHAIEMRTELPPKLEGTPPAVSAPVRFEPLTDPLHAPPALKEEKPIIPIKEPTLDPQSDVKMRDRSVSPPRQPRHALPPPTQRPMAPRRRVSRSPPRGPRNHSNTNNPNLPTGPASFHPSAPRGPRNAFPQPIAPSPSTTSPSIPSRSTFFAPAVPAPTQPRVVLPDLKKLLQEYKKSEAHKERIEARMKLISVDSEVVRLRQLRMRLTQTYVGITKNARRAIHELETATIDLHAAEARRKVCDSQLVKAQAGQLGIDAVQPEPGMVNVAIS